MRIQIVGRGRMATALEAALAGGPAGEVELLPLGGRGTDGAGSDAVLLAVPDAEIAKAARGIRPGPLVGHCSGATGLDALAPHEAFSLHPLLTVVGPGARFEGASAAVDGTTPRSLALAERLAELLGLEAFRVAGRDRAAYHAAASIASNFLVTVEGFAADLAGTAGVPRRALVPLVRAAVQNWAELGAADALTGPVARGDAATVQRQRDAVRERMPERLALFDALVSATEDLAALAATKEEP
ncbi:Rossmann-like and DUF2520 domain-containing protein [Leucobacter ruminantium]|uniref:DUF2520 domain-containing protein n=1 Tax=Leucobacter ruminantium TaxID=1289170 RepID=A0A939RZR9_9MICO|nr:Rossmann-like and DUF2520 domain-containing protein [Leucobacter ruminantium]MBO1805764.1 DUF2520 domain-containing protein [Leucobacter ruminantium]